MTDDVQILPASEIPEKIDLRGEILSYPDPLLTTKCDTVPFPLPAEIGKEVFDFIKRMLTHCIARNGAGLAANQLGELYRIFIMRVSNGGFLVCFNPEIISTGRDTEKVSEGCLSCPGIVVPKVRKQIVTLRFQDIDGNVCTRVLKRKEAYIAQHELDHLNGISFLPEKQDDAQTKN